MARHTTNGRSYEYRVINFIATEHLDALLGALAEGWGVNRSEVLRRLILEEGQRRHIEVRHGNGDRAEGRDASEAQGDG